MRSASRSQARVAVWLHYYVRLGEILAHDLLITPQLKVSLAWAILGKIS